MDSGELLITALTERFDQLKPLLKHHLAENNGGLLPHVIFWDFTQAVISSYLGRPPHVAWETFLAFLEEEYQRGDAYLKGIAEVSFLEYLPFPNEDGHEIVTSLPEDLRAAFWRVRPSG